MQTRCPNCDTLYRIDQDELATADGQVRCYRCETVFDAYQNQPAQDPEAQHPAAAQNGPEDSAADSLEDIFPASEFGSISSFTIDELDESQIVPTEDAAAEAGEPGPDSLPAMADGIEDELDIEVELAAADSGGNELDLAELADSLRHDSHREAPPEALNLDDLELGPLEAPPATEPELSREQEDELDRDLAPPPVKGRNPAAVIGQLLLILLLLATAAGQLAWPKREQLLKDPDIHRLAEQACSLAGCRLPLLHEPQSYQVIQRRLQPAEQTDHALSLQLSFRNGAPFPQALPDLQLSLFDREERLIARRRLSPDEYLFPAPTQNAAITPEEVVTIELLFEDPGSRASGFKLEFL